MFSRVYCVCHFYWCDLVDLHDLTCFDVNYDADGYADDDAMNDGADYCVDFHHQLYFHSHQLIECESVEVNLCRMH